MSHTRAGDVVVVGGGAIGLSIAWRLRLAGMSVTVLERGESGHGTSRVAAGMLAPVAEVEFGEAGLRALALGLRSAEIWPAFASELRDSSGIDIGLLRTGTLLLARDQDEARELERQLELRESLGLAVERLRPSEARQREPALSPTLRLALHAPDDHSVEPRALLAALRRACEAEGVLLREHVEVGAVELDRGGQRVTGVSIRGGESIAAGQLVLAAGPWIEAIAGLPARARVPIRPVKGQILRLRDPAGAGMLSRVLRFQGGYLVPRGDGRYVLGATVEERGFETAPTAGGVYELLRGAHELVPGVSELEIEELSVGLRPSTPDNAPAIGPGALAGLFWAAGHHRNGILLAPLSAELIAGMLAPGGTPASLAPSGGRASPLGARAGSSLAELAQACDPARFAAVPSSAGELTAAGAGR